MMDKLNTTDSVGISAVDRALFWFSTSIPDLIHQSKSDANRARIVGLGVLFTFLYACLAWIYFWSTSVTSAWLYIPLGLFLGFGVLTIDRMLIASIKAGKITIIPTLFRVLLALALGAFIAQPVILWMFQDDLQGQVAILNDQKVQERNQELLTIRDSQSAALIAEKSNIQDGIRSKYEDLLKARTSYQQEIDGTGGSQRYGISHVAREKARILERHEQEYADLERNSQPKLDSLNTRLAVIEHIYQSDFTEFASAYDNSGFLIQVEALQSLMARDTTGALRNRYVLLLVILVLFELVPIVSKIFLPMGSYDKHLELTEQKEGLEFQDRFERERSFDEQYLDRAIQQDKRLLSNFFKKSDETKLTKLEEETANWSNKGRSLKEKVRDVLIG